MGDNLGNYTDLSKVVTWSNNTSAPGTNRGPGPFIGIVKANTDPLRSGRLQVWISELGGNPQDDSSWRTVSYLTPFWGSTNNQSGGKNSYGMWFVPPDIGGRVLCMFVNGDPHRGYWMGCIPDFPNSHMVPGIAKPIDGSNPAPVTEADQATLNSDRTNISNFATFKRSPHPVQKAIWEKQGILQDPDRGPGTSTMYRETPSMVFGISTPGQPVSQPTYNSDPKQIGGGVSNVQEPIVQARKGGHTFVMDDGDSNGKNSQFRLRSGAGHMILMNDDAGKESIYVMHATGKSWFEMAKGGEIFVYNESNMKITAKAGFDLETDGVLNMHAKKDINIKSDTNVNIAGKDINVKADGSAKVTGKKELHLKGGKVHITGDSCIGLKSTGHIDLKGSCVTLNTSAPTDAKEAGDAKPPEKMPTHEPYNRGGGGAGAIPGLGAGNGATPGVGGVGAASGTSGFAQGGTDAVPGDTVAGGGVVMPDGTIQYPQNSGTQPTPNPAAQPSYNATAGMPAGAAGVWGLLNNFGDPNAPTQTYAQMTNNIGPTSYNPGIQGSYGGQSNSYASYIPSLGGSLTNVIGTVAGVAAGVAVANSISGSNNNTSYTYGTGQSYTVQSNLQNITYGTGSAFDTSNLSDSTIFNENYSVGEQQNNPGDLQYNSTDPWAIGFANNLAVYATAEDGIASMMNLFDTYAGGQQVTSAQLIASYLQTEVTTNSVVSFARFVENITGISPTSYVALGDALTRIAWASAVIQYIQGRIIYNYDQVLTGCAESIGMDPLTYAQYVQSGTQPYQNGYGSGSTGGFVNPASQQINQSGGGSLLGMLAGIATGSVVKNVVTDLFSSSGSSNPNSPSGSYGFADGSTTYGGYSGIPTSGGSAINTGIGGYTTTDGTTQNGILQSGVVYGSGECAAIAQSTIPGFGTMNQIQMGNQVLGNNDIAPGTVIVTGNFTNSAGQQAYAPDGSGGVYGQSHTAIYLGQGVDSNGQSYITVQDQWNGKPCGVRNIYNTGGAEGADKFYVAKSPANGYDSNGVQVPGSQNYQSASLAQNSQVPGSVDASGTQTFNATPIADAANPAGGAPTVSPYSYYEGPPPSVIASQNAAAISAGAPTASPYGVPTTYGDQTLSAQAISASSPTASVYSTSGSIADYQASVASSPQYSGSLNDRLPGDATGTASLAANQAAVDNINAQLYGLPPPADSTVNPLSPTNSNFDSSAYYAGISASSPTANPYGVAPTTNYDNAVLTSAQSPTGSLSTEYGTAYTYTPPVDTSGPLASYGRQNQSIDSAYSQQIASDVSASSPTANPLQDSTIPTRDQPGFVDVSGTPYTGYNSEFGPSITSPDQATGYVNPDNTNLYQVGPTAPYSSNPGDIATGGYGSGSNAGVDSAASPTLPPTSQGKPGEDAMAQSQASSSTAPITGQQPAPGTSGAAKTGGQATPKGTAATGAPPAGC